MLKETDVLEDLPLENIPLFRCVATESLEGILDRCEIRSLAQHQTLILADCENWELFILLSGRLRVHLQNLESEPIAYIQPGEMVGELSVIDRNRTSAFVVADRPSRVLVMEQELVWSLITVSHAAACNLLTLLSGRVRSANECIAEKMLKEHSFHSYGTIDVLTGMHNRHWLNQGLARIVKRSTYSGTPLSVLMIDIDAFKAFNDTHGHLCGDRAIHTVAKTLLENLRPMVMTARYGGDEFLIALPGVAVETAEQVAQRLLENVRKEQIPQHDGSFLPALTVSIGLVEVHAGQTVEDVIAAADAALYRAKAKGRDTVSQ
jgi:diguanylate cyclase (GGDEF)-like protein